MAMPLAGSYHPGSVLLPLGSWAAPALPGCPINFSVMESAFNVTGDGETDDSAALLAADAALDYLFFPPPNQYRIAENTTLATPVIVGLVSGMPGGCTHDGAGLASAGGVLRQLSGC